MRTARGGRPCGRAATGCWSWVEGMVSGELDGEDERPTLPSQRVGAITGSDLVVLQARDAIAKHDIRQFAVLPWRSPSPPRGHSGEVFVRWCPWPDSWQASKAQSTPTGTNGLSPSKKNLSRPRQIESYHHKFINSSEPAAVKRSRSTSHCPSWPQPATISGLAFVFAKS